MFKDSGEVIHFTNPKVQASLGSNTYAISGPSDTKCMSMKANFSLIVFGIVFSSSRNVTDNYVTDGHIN